MRSFKLERKAKRAARKGGQPDAGAKPAPAQAAAPEPAELRKAAETDLAIEHEVERRLEDARIAEPPPPAATPPPPEPELERPERIADLDQPEDDVRARRIEEERLARKLADAETRVGEEERRIADALERAAAKLREVEARADEAEERARRAERLVEAKASESERAGQLRQMLDRISDAERRAASAEARAREAVAQASEPLPGGEEIAGREQPEELPPLEPEDEPPRPHGDPLVPHPEPAPEPEPDTLAPDPEAPAPGAIAAAGPVSLNAASYEELRTLGLSVTQTGRLLAHREQFGSFSSLDELAQIPGFSRATLEGLKGRLVL